MLKIKQMLPKAFLSIAAVVIFFLSFKPVMVNDAYFGLKLGEFIISNGYIPVHEPFSWSAQGRTIVAYEWLFQVGLYELWKLGGFFAIQFFVALSGLLLFLLVFHILRYDFKRDFLSSILFSLLCVALLFEFIVARPHLVAFLLLLLLLHCIFSKKHLFWVIPIMYIWTNTHASFILGPVFLFFYAIFWRSKRLFLAGTAALIVTISPPLWWQPYALLFHFWKQRDVLTKFIVEWGPIARDPHYFWIYLTLLISVMASLFYAWQKREQKLVFSLFPLIALTLTPLVAIRNVGLGSLAGILTIGLVFPSFSWKGRKIISSVIASVALCSAVAYLAFVKLALAQPNLDYQKDIVFLKEHNIGGNMFNEFALGSYLLFYLYPDYQVFFDGRADVYFCCEMRDFLTVIEAKKTSSDEFRKTVDAFLNKYEFSFIVVPSPSGGPMEFTAVSRMTDILLDDPTWSLVYIGDSLEIIVRRDGKNDALITRFGTSAITPTRITPFRLYRAPQAIAEYQRMTELSESSIAWYGLGSAYFALGNLDEAEKAFETSLSIRPSGGSYLGLAKIKLERGQNEQSEQLLLSSIELSPFLGESYILLGQLYQGKNEIERMRTILNKALNEDIDLLSRQKIVQLLQSIN